MSVKNVYLQRLPAWFALVLVLFGAPAKRLVAQENKRDVAKLYEGLCSSCHGKNLEGGQTDSLLDDKWKHGGEDADLAKAILKRRLVFAYALTLTESRLLLFRFGLGTMDVQALIGSLDGMRLQLGQMALARQASMR